MAYSKKPRKQSRRTFLKNIFKKENGMKFIMRDFLKTYQTGMYSFNVYEMTLPVPYTPHNYPPIYELNRNVIHYYIDIKKYWHGEKAFYCYTVIAEDMYITGGQL